MNHHQNEITNQSITKKTSFPHADIEAQLQNLYLYSDFSSTTRSGHQDQLDHLGPIIRNIHLSKQQDAFLRHLLKFMRTKEAEIEAVCHANHQAPRGTNFHPNVLTSVIEKCLSSQIFINIDTTNVNIDSKEYRQVQSQKRSAIIRLVTRLLLQTDLSTPCDKEDCLGLLNHDVGMGLGVLDSLQMRLRIERNAAGRLLAITLSKSQTGVDSNGDRCRTLDANAILSKLNQMVTTNEARIQEDLIVPLMCKPSAYLRGVVRNQIVSLAQRSSVTVYKLLSRYLSLISETVVLDLRMNTKGLNLVAELLGTPNDVFLSQKSQYTVPRLVSLSNIPILERLASVIQDTLSNIISDHMVKILMTKQKIANLILLLNKGEKSALNNQSPKFSLLTLAPYCSGPLYFELIVEMRVSTEVNTIVKDQEVEDELRHQMLFILTVMNDTLQDLRGKYSIGNNIKVMEGLGNLIKIVKSGLNGFIPQITTTLQAALSIPAVREPALRVWDLFIKASSANDLKAFVGEVWNKLTPEQLTIATKIFHQILKKSKELGTKVYDIADITGLERPSLRSNTAPLITSDVHGLLKEAQQMLVSIKRLMSYLHKLRRLVDWLNDESGIVVRQSLKELKHSLYLEPDQIRVVTSGDSFDPVIRSLLKPLTGVAMRFNDISDDFKCLTFQCLGIIGALDPDWFEISDDGPGCVSPCQLWVQTANIARKAGHLQTSYSAVLQASELKTPTAFLQRSKLLKLEDQPHKAIAELERNLAHCTPKDSAGMSDDISTRDYATACLQRARWMDEVNRYDVNYIASKFDKLTSEHPEWSSPYYYFGRFYDEKATELNLLHTCELTLREELIPPERSLTVDPIPEEPPQPSSIPPQDPIPSVCVHEPSIAPQDLDPSLQFHMPVPAHRSPRHLASPKAQVNKGKQKMSKTVVFSLP
ncbi:uncharacterized protein MELLADRAFT_112732 [Melampsora larici-populina 98AG31]|uniref:UME domain-containing protein n=1 Tax=Melampsora larici-populina (strain 98AG31 / pathotype 3-4-7) TaxID=747676 RepID=F4S7E9_MELLP|nr:uncharacterized protein MELLADRAFT_112732 [Melampsora larici-populina 98AG31]EGF99436.1 hypothetical protein MELLADRAFT_112732 [Melampsora larici-populina 98AG31]